MHSRRAAWFFHAVVVARANLKEDRWDAEIDLVDVATKTMRAVTHGRMGAGSPRWSPTGDRLAFASADADKKGQVFVLAMDGGDAMQLTHSKDGGERVCVAAGWCGDGVCGGGRGAGEEG